jgi:hypothetical protein
MKNITFWLSIAMVFVSVCANAQEKIDFEKEAFLTIPLTKNLDGWEFKKGDWSIQPNNFDHSTASSSFDLCNTKSGQAIYTAKEFSNFKLGVKRDCMHVRYDWDTKILFRIQPENKDQYYYVQRLRSGLIRLAVQHARKKSVVISVSDVSVPVKNMIIETDENHFVIKTSSDGINYTKVIDAVDTENTYTNGYIGFFNAVHTHYNFDITPWHSNVADLKKGVWLENIIPTGKFISESPDETMVQIRAEYFSLGNNKVKFNGEVHKTNPGANVFYDYVKVKRGAKNYKVTIKAGKPITLTLDDPLVLGEAPEYTPFKGIETAKFTKQQYFDLINERYVELDKDAQSKKRITWGQTLPGVYAKLYQATGDEKYMLVLKEYMQNWIKGYKEGKNNISSDFVGRGPATDAILTLVENGNLTPEETNIIKQMSSELLVRGTFEGGGSMNRSLGYLLGVRPLLKLNPNHLLKQELEAYADNMEASVLQFLEELENSTNYQGISNFYLMQWIELNSREDLFDDPKLKNTLERMLACQTPIGGMTAYADYGNIDNADPLLAAVFERAATAYNDGRFKTAAAKIMAKVIAKYDPEKRGSGWTLWGLSSAIKWCDDSVEPLPYNARSMSTKRNNGDEDKVILRNENAYVLFDMINGREHGDYNILGLMAYIVDGKYRLWDKGGRQQDVHSMPLIVENNKDFPYKQRRKVMSNPVERDRWALAELYLPNHWSWGNFAVGVGQQVQYAGLHGADRHVAPDYNFLYNTGSEFSFYIEFKGNGKFDVLIDDVKLIDDQGEELLLEDFSGGTKRWIGDMSWSEDAVVGNKSAKFSIDMNSGKKLIGKVFDMPLDIDNGKYKKISFRYKLLEPVDEDLSLGMVCIGDVKGYRRNYLFHHNPMFTGSVSNIDVQDNSVTMEVKERSLYNYPQTKTRNVELAENGSLIIHDTLDIDGKRPYVAGPVFQVDKVLERGINYFVTCNDAPVLIWFKPVANSTYGIGQLPKPAHVITTNPNTSVYQKIFGNAPAIHEFTTVLVPLKNLEELDEALKQAETLTK